MFVQPVPPGARGTDSVQEISAEQAKALAASGFDFCVRYIHSTTTQEVLDIVGAGLGFMPVTFADRFDGRDAADACAKLGLPAGVTVWLDLEGQNVFHLDRTILSQTINAWADAVKSGGFMPGLYVGVPQPLTSAELYALRVTRYWRGQGSIRDHANQLAEPTCGWCMLQTYPSHWRSGVWVDVDVAQHDYHNRAPAWAHA